MLVVYIGGYDAVTVPDVGIAERDGAPVDVAEDVAAGLIARGDFRDAATPAAEPAATQAAEPEV